jgi:hypothetical protein
MEFYVYKNDQQVGPYSLMDLRDRLQKGEFAYTDLAWRDGLADWTPLKDLLGGSLPDATPHAVAPPTTAAFATAPTVPTGARVGTAIVIFIITFIIFFIVFFILECIVGGIYATAQVAHQSNGQPLTPDQTREAGRALGEKYGLVALGLCFLLSSASAGLTAWKMSFSNLFPWCRAK